jgi:hypothetical protein
MADAAERYAAKWGPDKVTAVNCDGRLGAPTVNP